MFDLDEIIERQREDWYRDTYGDEWLDEEREEREDRNYEEEDDDEAGVE